MKDEFETWMLYDGDERERTILRKAFQNLIEIFLGFTMLFLLAAILMLLEPLLNDRSQSQSTPAPKKQVIDMEQPVAKAEYRIPDLKIKKLTGTEAMLISGEPAVYLIDSTTLSENGGELYLVPTETGRYRVEIQGLSLNGNHHLTVRAHDPIGNQITKVMSFRNGDGFNLYNAKTETPVRISADANDASFMLLIGSQKTITEVTADCIVHDSIQYTNQRNVYLFTPEMSGEYMIRIEDLPKDATVDVGVFTNEESPREVVAIHTMVGGQRLMLENLNADTTYQIQVRHRKGYVPYALYLY